MASRRKRKPIVLQYATEPTRMIFTMPNANRTTLAIENSRLKPEIGSTRLKSGINLSGRNNNPPCASPIAMLIPIAGAALLAYGAYSVLSGAVGRAKKKRQAAAEPVTAQPVIAQPVTEPITEEPLSAEPVSASVGADPRVVVNPVRRAPPNGGAPGTRTLPCSSAT